jgi:transcriptional regulator with XRE-family HTH domain
MSTLGNIRKKLGLTQSEIGAMLGLSKSAVCMIEQGWRILSSEKQQKLQEIEAQFENRAMGEMQIDEFTISSEVRLQSKRRARLPVRIWNLILRYRNFTKSLRIMKREFQVAEKNLKTLLSSEQHLDFSINRKGYTYIQKARKKYLANHPERWLAIEIELKALAATLEIYVKELEDEVLRGQVVKILKTT